MFVFLCLIAVFGGSRRPVFILLLCAVSTDALIGKTFGFLHHSLDQNCLFGHVEFESELSILVLRNTTALCKNLGLKTDEFPKS